MVLTSLSLLIPVFLDLNFCSSSVVVIGFLRRYRRTESSVIPSVLPDQLLGSGGVDVIPASALDRLGLGPSILEGAGDSSFILRFRALLLDDPLLFLSSLTCFVGVLARLLPSEPFFFFGFCINMADWNLESSKSESEDSDEDSPDEFPFEVLFDGTSFFSALGFGLGSAPFSSLAGSSSPSGFSSSFSSSSSSSDWSTARRASSSSTPFISRLAFSSSGSSPSELDADM
uniref:Putative secreted protein n=1 Tax=Ixodes ricinus TaxID=34613 RepID=A0A6B0V3B8_IXORI